MMAFQLCMLFKKISLPAHKFLDMIDHYKYESDYETDDKNYIKLKIFLVKILLRNDQFTLEIYYNIH